ncbi:PKD domain-containing protein [Pelobium sp.]|nr:PKD domain-containing protein [Pelobium sp.]MDA9554821.1 PKD domain-containing protein [Pelobium sp.]
MMNHIKSLIIGFLITGVTLSSCKKTEYSFGALKSPTDVVLTTTIAGVDTNNPNGNGTGKVLITTTSTNAITYKIDFGDGITQMVPSGTINYKYSTPGVNEYTVTVNAIGTGGITSTTSKKIKVFVAFEIPAAILNAFTGSGSKVWITDHDADGHFGVGPGDGFAPTYYAATPNSREACAYDDEITFSKDANNNIYMSVDNKGASFSIAAATAFYGVSGPDGCYAISTGGNKKLAFADATSASTTANSTRIQFTVPGNGIINFGTGGTTYEIIAFTDNTMFLRNIGSDGNSWYQKLKVK